MLPMYEGLDHWGYVVAAYAINVAAIGGMVLWSVLAMRAAVARRSAAREQRSDAPHSR